LIVAESGFHELDPEEFGRMLSPLPNERRRSQRLQTVPNHAVLEWWDRSQKRSSEGKILNISDHGALICADSFPQLGENVLIRMKRPVQSDWAGSIVVRQVQQHEVAIDFNMSCPYDLGLAATLGIDIISSVLGLAGSDRFSNSGD
jgi:PilZ domain